jgi:hypothetical protein
MVGDRQVWQSDRGGLFIDNAVVSFQRYPCPSDKIVGDAPSSYGALPVAPEGDHHLLPLPDQEAFWVGIILPKDWDRGTLSFVAMHADGGVLVSEQFIRPGMFVIPGIKRPDGQFDVFCRESVSELLLAGAGGITRIVVSDPRTFATRTGQAPPEPFDPNSAFGGWMLP